LVETAWPSQLFNAEEDDFPFDPRSVDVVLFCEILEHLLMDPVAVLRRIHRVLKPGGLLVLTTPNVLRIENVLALVNGANIFDQYSGFGPYGRHNREYTPDEVHRLLEFAGFEVESLVTADGHSTDVTGWSQYQAVAPMLDGRRGELGQYTFVRARANRDPRDKLPSFFYRSRPEGEIVP
jgi:SAM-dependent methyltransferase